MNNILVVNINWLGDAIFSTPVFGALRKAYPRARICCLCVPRVEGVLRHCPLIDEVIVYDEKGRDRWVWNKVALIWRLRRERFDVAFLLHRSMTRGLLVFLSGIPRRIGYGKAKGLLTHPIQGDDAGLHRRDYYLRVVEDYGIDVHDRHCQLRLNQADIHALDAKLQQQGIGPGQGYIVFNTGGNWDLKRWPLTRWAALAQTINQKSNLPIVFSGAPKDNRDVQEILNGSNIKAVDLTGQTTLGESLALFYRAKVVISADSGPLHLAHSVGGKVIGLFGPTREEITGPRGTGEAVILFNDVGCNKAPCYHLACGNNVCMQSIGVEDVWEAVHKFIR